MRTPVTLLFSLLLSLSAIPDRKSIPGNYYDYFGSHLHLRADSTFSYEWHFDTQGHWCNGTWTLHGDTLLLTGVPIYDTASVYSNHKTTEEIMLSADTIPSRIYPDTVYLPSGTPLIRWWPPTRQNVNADAYPTKLYFKRSRLYQLDSSGKPDRSRIKGFWSKKKYPTYYTRVKNG